MQMDSNFNLIDEPWIPISGHGLVSLEDIFTDRSLTSLGGTPIEKIALTKLLLAIAQAAITPNNESEWEALGADGLAAKCRAYLAQWYDRFYLYGDQPFLQIPEIEAANTVSLGVGTPYIATGNTVILNHSSIERDVPDQQKAVLLVTLMSMALGNKKTDSSVTLSPGYSGKLNKKGQLTTRGISKSGPGIQDFGLLHTFVNATTLHLTLWLNLVTRERLRKINSYQYDIGTPPWEVMPVGEDCPVAQKLRGSLMGRLVPMARFCLLNTNGMHYSDGINHPNYLEGYQDPSVAIRKRRDGVKPVPVWADPKKRPWRELSSLLSYLSYKNDTGFQCFQLQLALSRVRAKTEYFWVWSGGIRVKTHRSGEQHADKDSDFVESRYQLKSANLGQNWFALFKNEMDSLDKLSKKLDRGVKQYHAQQKMDGASKAAAATNQFWQLCERYAQMLIDSCDQTDSTNSSLIDIRKRFANFISKTYDQFCPRQTARQMTAWARCRPNISKYLKKTEEISNDGRH